MSVGPDPSADSTRVTVGEARCESAKLHSSTDPRRAHIPVDKKAMLGERNIRLVLENDIVDGASPAKFDSSEKLIPGFQDAAFGSRDSFEIRAGRARGRRVPGVNEEGPIFSACSGYFIPRARGIDQIVYRASFRFSRLRTVRVGIRRRLAAHFRRHRELAPRIALATTALRLKSPREPTSRSVPCFRRVETRDVLLNGQKL